MVNVKTDSSGNCEIELGGDAVTLGIEIAQALYKLCKLVADQAGHEIGDDEMLFAVTATVISKLQKAGYESTFRDIGLALVAQDVRRERDEEHAVRPE